MPGFEIYGNFAADESSQHEPTRAKNSDLPEEVVGGIMLVAGLVAARSNEG